jgi:ABC-type multidrug transport system fused ATPase/permease subunit
VADCVDQATSSIDPITETTIQNAVNMLCSQTRCTLLSIAHRLETVIGMDRILVMADGEVAEFGEPQELMRKGGAFAELATQAGLALDL